MTATSEAYRKATSSPAGRETAETVKSMGEQVSDFADDVGRMASKQYGRAQDMAVDAFDDAHSTIKGNPLTAIAIALGIGVLIGLAAGSRR
jgi:ElaB/YqjD/DUF883 family membrane-anchored ribosome-binding protein